MKKDIRTILDLVEKIVQTLKIILDEPPVRKKRKEKRDVVR